MLTRPQPPAALMDSDEATAPNIVMPAPEIGEWVKAVILDKSGPLYNPAHDHLEDADLEFMWAGYSFQKQGMSVLGQCEEVMFRAGGWQKVRQEQQMIEWFGRVPQFIITLAADYCLQCGDTDFCALVEHELFHLTQDLDKYGAPRFTKEGLPALKLRGHDVSEFVDVVERYGMGPAEGALARMVQAANKGPSLGRASIARACGNCLKVAA